MAETIGVPCELATSMPLCCAPQRAPKVDVRVPVVGKTTFEPLAVLPVIDGDSWWLCCFLDGANASPSPGTDFGSMTTLMAMPFSVCENCGVTSPL